MQARTCVHAGKDVCACRHGCVCIQAQMCVDAGLHVCAFKFGYMYMQAWTWLLAGMDVLRCSKKLCVHAGKDMWTHRYVCTSKLGRVYM